ncbi:probable receptor-like protein kinase At2g21480 [Beta vulgaris subsp. vulgaris]|uniref:probable receptor-like protein kinase At2g21480 n=1 Tax=Beta vulgaris subsp. vulgaris TaxID=3555 RepID=UPI0020366D14|nr:probable receptor-like protein kinase At2g21480 [Beta vulgaris subsp. vulgaris]
MDNDKQPLTLHSSSRILSSSLSFFMSTFFFYIVLISLASTTFAAPTSFNPKDNFYIACGSNDKVTTPDGKSYQSDQEAQGFLSAEDKYLVSDPNANVPSKIYTSARVFLKDATYTFTLQDSGWHWVRLHFLPIKTDVFKLETASFNVFTNEVTLLHSFSATNITKKEYLIHVKSQSFSIKFEPQKNSAAFINAIEVTTAPDKLIGDSGQSLSPVGQYDGLDHNSLETMYRVNVGGSRITAENDTLGRTWVPDEDYIKNKPMSKNVNVQTSIIKYPEGVTPYIAPQTVYSTAAEMADANTMEQSFNITWDFNVEKSYSYLVRLHFCDIVSTALNDLYFNVYINGKSAISGLDLSSLTGKLATPNFQDIVVDSSLVDQDKVSVQIGPAKIESGPKNAILNGVEVFKMNNSVSSLDGEFGPDGKAMSDGKHKKTVAAVGFAMMFGAFVGLGAMVIKWHKRPQDWQRRNSFSSWLLPLHAGDSTVFGKSNYGSHKSSIFSTGGLGRKFTFDEIKESTNNFEASGVIGVGGFGNVYIGFLDGNQVAVKRGNPQSEQGINEFMTEIQMLSKLRHKHLVSLIGYCDENNEMILVYEYMSNGPLRDHLYGKNMPPLSWKQRLEISIGAARGLHYLHTGSAQGIIHRDVKTTNILLDENFVAKMADFGLSKDGPGQQADHVSTAVKGSFGYLDPEYFRKQQLTDKSDVYSFGVVLLEVLCARAAIDPTLSRDQVNLAEWAMNWKRKGMLEKILDPILVGSINPESMKKFAEAAEKCLAEYGSDRPTMGDVLWNLEYALQLQEASAQGKTEDIPTNVNPTAPAPAPAPGAGTAVDTAPETRPSAIIPEQTQAIDERSGTALLAQFNNLSGR